MTLRKGTYVRGSEEYRSKTGKILLYSILGTGILQKRILKFYLGTSLK